MRVCAYTLARMKQAVPTLIPSAESIARVAGFNRRLTAKPAC